MALWSGDVHTSLVARAAKRAIAFKGLGRILHTVWVGDSRGQELAGQRCAMVSVRVSISSGLQSLPVPVLWPILRQDQHRAGSI